MDKEIEILKKRVDKVLWWCPFRNLRHFLRRCLYNIIDLEETNYLAINVDRKLQFLLEKQNLEFVNENGILIIYVGEGLADQICYYFMGIYAEIYHNRTVKYDITGYGENINGVRNNNRNFELTNIAPNLKFEVATDKEINLFKRLFHIDEEGKDIKRRNIYNECFS